MLEKRLLAMLTICLIVAGSVGRFAPGALGLVLAHCCCGPHDAADACHCPDCPAAHPQEGDAQDRDDASGDSPTMGTCTLEQVLARVPAASPTVTTSVVNQRSTFVPSSAASRTSSRTSSVTSNRAVTAVLAGRTNSISPALSQTTYPGPRLCIIRSIQNGSVIANNEPPNWVPT